MLGPNLPVEDSSYIGNRMARNFRLFVPDFALPWFFIASSLVLCHTTSVSSADTTITGEQAIAKLLAEDKTALAIEKLLDTGEERKAIEEWKRFIADSFTGRDREELAWKIARASIRLGEHDNAIAAYKSHYPVLTDSIEQRAQLGEVLLFGAVGAPRSDTPVGKGQCHLCHRIFKETVTAPLKEDPFQPYLFNFSRRIKELIASPSYQSRPKDTEQPEAYPGSGKATSLIEYLAESNVCPSCYIVPRIGFKNDPRESVMPKTHRTPISLTIDEMVAIDTWLLKQEGEEIPSLAVMRAAYEKFLLPKDRPGFYKAIRLASLYDAAGEIDTALDLIQSNYGSVVANLASKSITALRNDPSVFANLRKKPDIVAKFPQLLRPDTRR
jgi:hypothetical protein